VKKPLSAWHGVLIGLGLCAFSYALVSLGLHARVVLFLVAASTSLWAAIDSAKMRIREYSTILAAHPVLIFIGMIILSFLGTTIQMALSWPVVFAWYLVVRSRIRAGQLKRRDHPNRVGLAVLLILLIPVGAELVFVLVRHTLFIGASTSIKGAWPTSNSGLAAAASTAGTPTPQDATGAAVPPIVPVSQEVSEPVPFDSVDALLKDDGRVRGKAISVKTKLSSVGVDEIEFETGEEWFNWRVTCQFPTEQQMALQNLKQGQELTITGTVPAEGTTQLRAPTPEQTGLYELKLSGCRIP
jgi:hypothetical protein